MTEPAVPTEPQPDGGDAVTAPGIDPVLGDLREFLDEELPRYLAAEEEALGPVQPDEIQPLPNQQAVRRASQLAGEGSPLAAYLEHLSAAPEGRSDRRAWAQRRDELGADLALAVEPLRSGQWHEELRFVLAERAYASLMARAVPQGPGVQSYDLGSVTDFGRRPAKRSGRW